MQFFVVSVLLHLIILGIIPDRSISQLTCFKKFNKKSKSCGGLIKKKNILTLNQCCTDNGRGFTYKDLEALDKKKYKCTSCQEWTNDLKPSSSPTTPQFVCFRKYRDKNQRCSGAMKISKAHNVEQCCRGAGSGYSVHGLEQTGKNNYKCRSCQMWIKEQVQTSTPMITTEAVPYWAPWGLCSTTCGTGVRFRYKICSTCDNTDLRNREAIPCTVHFYCPIDGDWGSWLQWTDCTTSCDGGVRRRERQCDSPPPKFGGKVCEGSENDVDICNGQPCPVDGNWGQWSHFGQCSYSCGRGEMSRTRECNNPPSSGGGQPCQGSRVDTRNCEKRKCPIHGGWSEWQEWSACPTGCVSGIRMRSRLCDSPRPLFSGNNCEGSSEETTVCSQDPNCPVNGGWSEWSSYGNCRAAASCAKGFRIRSRSCNNPRPQNRGSMCRGISVEQIPCMNNEGCAVDGSWCEYGHWSPCSSTCIESKSVQKRFRACYCPGPENGGKSCEGNFEDTQECFGVESCGQPSITVDG